MRTILIAAAAALLFGLPAAIAQTTTTTVITEQPATGTIIELPGEVRTYVTQQKIPSVTFDGDVVVGTALPDTVEYQVIPDNDKYGYAIVNNRRVIVDAGTRNVIEVYE